MEMQLSLSHLGYQPGSPKTVTLLPGDKAADLPEVIPFYLRQNCLRMPRENGNTEGFSRRFPSPYDLMQGKLLAGAKDQAFFSGELRRAETRWGVMWRGDFSAFRQPGSYQIETDWQISPPFAIHDRIYDRIIAGYLAFLRTQRCGCAVFGIHEPCHLDDGILDSDGSERSITGGWHDAGDFRKWLAFTLQHIDALVTLHERSSCELVRGGITAESLLGEINWGNRFFHAMIDKRGQVYEDVASGSAPPGSQFTYEKDWWFENHPGCYGDASDNRWTDNIPGSGDERKIRTSYNPLVQWSFVAAQACASRHLPEAEGQGCLRLAQKAADFARNNPHDGRTLFFAAELRATLELMTTGCGDRAQLHSLAHTLMQRQANSGEGLSGYFTEAGDSDAFRSIAFNAAPAFALLRLCELHGTVQDEDLCDRARESVSRYIASYLLADSASNPFSLTPYGVYFVPPMSSIQAFRDAGMGRGVRTFMHPYNAQGIAHGTSSVIMSHAHLLARAAHVFANPAWRASAEKLLQWCLGHNTLNRSLYSGIGYRQPVGYSYRIPQLPEAMFVGFIGRPDDSPYLEESTAIEWNTLEYWSIPYIHAAQAACWLSL